jgi:hypothetical protein
VRDHLRGHWSGPEQDEQRHEFTHLGIHRG